MKPKALGIVLGLAVAMVGCSLTETGSRNDGADPPDRLEVEGGPGPPGDQAGHAEDGRRLAPEADPALGVAIWQVADEQAIESEARRALQANGLRVGRVSGDLPTEVEAVLHAPPPRKVEILTIVIPEGEPTLIDPGTAPIDSLNLILDQKGWPVGKVYQDAHGFARVTASYDGNEGVALRILPELHHGPDPQRLGNGRRRNPAHAQAARHEARPAGGDLPRPGRNRGGASRARSPCWAAVTTVGAASATSCSASRRPTATAPSRRSCSSGQAGRNRVMCRRTSRPSTRPSRAREKPCFRARMQRVSHALRGRRLLHKVGSERIHPLNFFAPRSVNHGGNPGPGRRRPFFARPAMDWPCSP